MPNPKRPSDINQRAALIVNIATGEAHEEEAPDTRDPNAVARGKKGGAAGGRSRAASLTPEERSKIAKEAAAKRWGPKSKE